jgi:N-glycosylase/DNA lyase
LIGHVNEQAFHDFPSPESLTGLGVEAHLRELGFGYRAKYLAQTAMIVASKKPPGWLDSLCNTNTGPAKDNYPKDIPKGGRAGYRRAHNELLELQGVGPKVADCVCLMGLGWSGKILIA